MTPAAKGLLEPLYSQKHNIGNIPFNHNDDDDEEEEEEEDNKDKYFNREPMSHMSFSDAYLKS